MFSSFLRSQKMHPTNVFKSGFFVIINESILSFILELLLFILCSCYGQSSGMSLTCQEKEIRNLGKTDLKSEKILVSSWKDFNSIFQSRVSTSRILPSILLLSGIFHEVLVQEQLLKKEKGIGKGNLETQPLYNIPDEKKKTRK